MTHIVAVGSIKGAGGVTTTAIVYAAATAAAGGGPVTVVEADPSGGSLLGWCGQLDAGFGLYEAVFDRARGVAGVAQRLGDIEVVVAQGDPFRISVALGRPRGWQPILTEVDGVVVVDVGRLYPGSPAAGIVGIADVVVLVSPPEPGPLAATLEWAGRGGQFHADDTALDADRVKVVTVDVTARSRQRVDPNMLAREHLGGGYVGHLPFDDQAVDLLYRGASLGHRSLRRTSLAGAAAGVAAAVGDAGRVGLWR